jgi:MFS family permease
MGSMYYGFYYTGAIASGILCIGGLYINSDWSWRMPLLCQVVGPIIATAITVRAYDSPRFLVKKGKVDDAHDFLASHHANGVRDDPLVLFELH